MDDAFDERRGSRVGFVEDDVVEDVICRESFADGARGLGRGGGG